MNQTQIGKRSSYQPQLPLPAPEPKPAPGASKRQTRPLASDRSRGTTPRSPARPKSVGLKTETAKATRASKLTETANTAKGAQEADWRLDDATRRIGLAGLTQARAALARASASRRANAA